eukprot:TRINITY_DN8357_c0_g1_i1.p1 TRINITY_DN8357_c0_g1~~TRINITY_DN8357_c0_g1_i1.p1  ORF type:complete len:249 (+),score=58.60 TRINITY_DN8357_c0_g1_i1:142-888(+)
MWQRCGVRRWVNHTVLVENFCLEHHAYLWHFTHWDDFADVSFFFHGYPHAHTCSLHVDAKAFLCRPRWDTYWPLNWQYRHRMCVNDIAALAATGLPSSCEGQWIGYWCCGQFLATRDRILRRRTHFAAALQRISTHSGYHLQTYRCAMHMEVMWHLLFGEPVRGVPEIGPYNVTSPNASVEQWELLTECGLRRPAKSMRWHPASVNWDPSADIVFDRPPNELQRLLVLPHAKPIRAEYGLWGVALPRL